MDRDDMPAMIATGALAPGRIVAAVKPRVAATFDRLEVRASGNALVTIGGTVTSVVQVGLVALLATAWATWTAAPGAIAVADVTPAAA